MVHSRSRLRPIVAALLFVLAGLGPTSASAQATFGDILKLTEAAPRAAAREGQPTEATGGPVAETAVGQEQAVAKPEPFGASIFRNAVAPASDAANPDYLIQPGDRVAVNILGGPTPSGSIVAGTVGAGGESTSLVVDPQGNIFLPEVGPIRVAGVSAGQLGAAVQQQAGRVYTDRVKVYAVLQSTHRVGVYVTGFVARPGRYAGTASDSVLDYLIRAGGVDPSRGSYRHIALLRSGQTVAHIDLYQFLLTGEAPNQPLREGDTIFVAKQNAMVAVAGAVRNNYLFELLGAQGQGADIVTMARPLPSATRVVLSGSRANKPFSVYLTLQALASTSIFDQDQLTFVGDEPETTVRVRVEGSRIGPSYLVLPTDSRLPATLDSIAVDPALADKGSAYILRHSIAQQQTRVINEAMDRLQKQLYLAVSPTTGVSTIRASEAQLISTYIQKARLSPPEGRLVVTDDSGRPADIRLEDDDVIVIPRKSQVVMVSGEVLAPQAEVYRPELKPEDYIRLAGGYTERGRSGRYLIRRANGAVFLTHDVTLRPGDELVVPPYIDPKLFQLGTDVFSLFYQVAVGASILHTVVP